MSTWLSARELAGLPGMPASQQHVLRRAQAERWTNRPRVGRGRTGCEYLITDLPEATQQTLAIAAAGAIQPAMRAMAAGQTVSQAQQVQAHANAMARLGVTLEAAGAFDPSQNPRLDLFQRFESYHRARGGAIWPAITEFCALWDAGEISAYPKTAEAYLKLPAKTLDKWYRAWRTSGVEALLERKPRKDKGLSQLAADEALHEVFIAALVEMHDPTARQVRRVIADHLGEDRAPEIRTLQIWIREFKASNKVALLKLKNPDGWRNKYMPAFGSRSEHISAPNVEWQLDSTIADAQQRVEIVFNMPDSETGEIRRHALVAVIDVFTRRAKVLVSRTSSSNAVKAVTRAAMLAWGQPERVKTDNGKDYTAADYDFALDSLKVGHILCTPFSPDQKPFIERFLGTLLHDLFPMLHGFVGHDVTTRKAIESGRSFAQRFGHGGCDLHMSPEQLQGTINGWLDEYENRVHSELGCSPNEMAARHTTHVLRVDPRALDLFMMQIAGNGVRTVGKRGISLDNAFFTAPELAAVDVMGMQVYCRQDDADLGALHVFAMDGSYICRALDHTRLGINRSELAAKTRALETATVKPLVDALRKAKRKGLVNRAVQSIYQDREATAVDSSNNVTRLAPREVQHSTPAIDSALAGTSQPAADRTAVREVFANEAPVVRMDTAKQRYSAWVRLSARASAGEQLSSRDVSWLNGYHGSTEFAAWHDLHQGIDPLAEAIG